jgi:thiol-disulfide isomerase/thioredoxin
MAIQLIVVAVALAAACLMSLALPSYGDGTASFRARTHLAEVQRAAPNFVGNSAWLNSGPLNLADLRGKVVLVDFWTYGCINCIRTLPYVTRLYDTYRDRGLVVVGVHTPEFSFEKSTSNVQTAINRYGIKYPVAQDNDYATWSAYRNHYWPAQFIIDKSGRIVFEHAGEGQYGEIQKTIEKLLNLNS